MPPQFIPNRKIGWWAMLVVPLIGLGLGLDRTGADDAAALFKPVSPSSNAAADTTTLLALSDWGTESLVHPKNSHPPNGLQGAASCAAAGCHGGPQVGVAAIDAPRGSEYPLWIESDPHARSWQTLNSPASIEILNRLSILQDGQIVAPEAYQNCLACHNTARSLLSDGISPTFSEGVGCEACHGAAEKWASEHFQGPHSVRRAQAELGLVDLQPLVRRAKACALCHVGGPDRDMNHDIIAAGHPALYFDMAVYHEAYPKHWRDSNPNPESFRAQLWLAGQLAQADAELELIAARASRSHSVSVWPEFSNYQCTSCHQRLDGSPESTIDPIPLWASNENIAKQASPNQANSGQARIRQWNLQGIRVLLDSHPTTTPSHTLPPLKAAWLSLERGMQSSSAITQANADALSQAAEDLRSELARVVFAPPVNGITSVGPMSWTMSWPMSWTAVDQRNWAARQLSLASQTLEWESASMAYVALWAAMPPNPTLDTRQLVGSRHMQTLRRGLIFPSQSQSPVFPRMESNASTPSQQEWSDALSHLLRELGEPLR
jgi:hypothetical protein